MEERQMTISIKADDREVSIKCDKDIDIFQVGEELKLLLLAWGFHPDNVNELFNEEPIEDSRDEE